MNKKILIVDDDDSILEILVDAIQSEKYLIKTATSGMQAIEMFQKESFDCLVTDINMPGMDGVQLVHKLYELEFKPMVFVVTGYSDYPREKLNAIKPRAIFFKPFDVTELSEVIFRYLK